MDSRSNRTEDEVPKRDVDESDDNNNDLLMKQNHDSNSLGITGGEG